MTEEVSQDQATSSKDAGGAEVKKVSPVAAAALFGGTVAAAAGAYFGTRALARKNREKDGRPINSVMATAITACDLAHSKAEEEASEKA
ncbi:MAG TPA: hypothetical protein VNT25_05130 [Allosphingosinicella sp.]|nr:hypothetical protein [Allosphingosinicella sp.]